MFIRSATCGIGYETRSCACPAPANGGAACVGSTITACTAGNCLVNGGWSDWSPCPVSCDVGTQTRSVAQTHADASLHSFSRTELAPTLLQRMAVLLARAHRIKRCVCVCACWSFTHSYTNSATRASARSTAAGDRGACVTPSATAATRPGVFRLIVMCVCEPATCCSICGHLQIVQCSYSRKRRRCLHGTLDSVLQHAVLPAAHHCM